ncbi:hypothetical protein [Demetria terragena]|uniref:hypothetical protein n=1 Tax=Demetria terragena TaxID=63959 RepID=UPI00036C21C9|nr:hypothetical protein [Demetria terragena]
MRISEKLTWPVVWPGKRGVFKRLLGSAVEAGINSGPWDSQSADSGPALRRVNHDTELPDDPDAELLLERLTTESADGVLRDVVLTQTGASVEAAPHLDLLRANVVEAQSQEDQPTAVASHWEFTVDADGERVMLYGPWLTFAWLGYLAGWPAPAAATSAVR